MVRNSPKKQSRWQSTQAERLSNRKTLNSPIQGLTDNPAILSLIASRLRRGAIAYFFRFFYLFFTSITSHFPVVWHFSQVNLSSSIKSVQISVLQMRHR